MRTITFRQLLDRSVRLCGLPPARLDAELAEAFASWLEARLRRAWEIFPWPELCPIEQRALRDEWEGLTQYELGDQVAFTDSSEVFGYYELAGLVPAGTSPEDDPEAWEAASSLDKYIDYLQIGKGRIGEVIGIWNEDPRITPAPTSIGYGIGSESIALAAAAGAQVWLQYRLPPPRFTTELYDAARTYTEEDVFYFAETGQCYVPLEETLGNSPAVIPELFEIQPVPHVLADYAARGARADWLADDGQEDKARGQELLAASWLEDQMLTIGVLQGQAGTYAVR